MDTYAVVVTLESPDNPDGVEMKWYSGRDPLKAVLAVGQCVEHHTDVHPDNPLTVRMMGVRIDVTAEPDTYWCTHCGMRTHTDDLTVIGRNCAYTNFDKPHRMIRVGTIPTEG